MKGVRGSSLLEKIEAKHDMKSANRKGLHDVFVEHGKCDFMAEVDCCH